VASENSHREETKPRATEAEVDLIPARLAWDHVDRLDGLNQFFSA